MKSDFSKMPQVIAKMRKAIDAGVTAACRELVGEAKRSIGTGQRFTHAAPGMPPNAQRGGLRRQIGFIPAQNGRGRVVSAARYSRQLEYGGTIRPRSTAYLPVPMCPEAMRMQERLGAGGSLKSYKLTYIPASKGKGPWLARVSGKGKNEKTTFLFVLKKSVTTRPHPFMAPSLAKARPAMVKHMAAAAKRVMGMVQT